MIILRNKLVFNVREPSNISGITVMPKGQLAARALQQVHGLDYSTACAAVVSFTSI